MHIDKLSNLFLASRRELSDLLSQGYACIYIYIYIYQLVRELSASTYAVDLRELSASGEISGLFSMLVAFHGLLRAWRWERFLFPQTQTIWRQVVVRESVQQPPLLYFMYEAWRLKHGHFCLKFRWCAIAGASCSLVFLQSWSVRMCVCLCVLFAVCMRACFCVLHCCCLCLRACLYYHSCLLRIVSNSSPVREL
jgi:hypothetical protein